MREKIINFIYIISFHYYYVLIYKLFNKSLSLFNYNN